VKVLAIMEICAIILVGIGVGWLVHPGAGIAAAGLLLFLETGFNKP